MLEIEAAFNFMHKALCIHKVLAENFLWCSSWRHITLRSTTFHSLRVVHGILETTRPSVVPWVRAYFENATHGRYYSQQNLKAFFWQIFCSDSFQTRQVLVQFFIQSQFQICFAPGSSLVFTGSDRCWAGI
jgi:hypothetical protein